MKKIKILTAGESHGKGLIGVIEGVPSGFKISAKNIDNDLKRRQGGHGRGGRMKIESDRVKIFSGVRWGKSLGSPIALIIENRDWPNWQEGMSEDPTNIDSIAPVVRPRPGHADLAGGIKYWTKDLRDILERSSARETASRVALGAIAKQILEVFNIFVGSYVTQIGKVKHGDSVPVKERLFHKIFRAAEESPVRCPNENDSRDMIECIDMAANERNSLGGVFKVFATGVPIGLGSHVHWDRKLDARLTMGLMSIQAIKGVEVGMGFGSASLMGSEVMDEIHYSKKKAKLYSRYFRKTNNAGGIEGGMSNGQPIVLSAAMKPIPTLKKPLRSIDIVTKDAVSAAYERSDICAVPAASVVGEAMVALILADAFLEKFGGDSLPEISDNYNSYLDRLNDY